MADSARDPCGGRAGPTLLYEREQELFDACLALAPDQQNSYLQHSCEDASYLRDRVQRLLAAHERAASDSTLSPLQAMHLDDTADVIGPYRLIRLLGEGGMGSVYEAEQLEPVHRRVALKIVKLGMDTRQVVGRFMTERQVLAAMDHPYVAKVFDAGHTVSGRPYFVMELVDGVPLLDYCERNQLSIRQRADLFIRICQAVQHAHQKGVVHRDLKPSNVLVTAGAEGPMPKIIDFGIAKAVGLDFPEYVTRLSRSEQALGTPAYMSPEQAGLGATDIDTRTDVYSLGVMLYELLVGCLPVDPAETGYTEFLSMLAKGEVEPPKPSSRSTIPAGLQRQVRRDLDWIVMKALEVDRSRRYDTAIALAEDLGRYLKEQPVAARPPTLSYRAGKFVRRHRVQVAAASIAAVALLAGTIAVTVGFVRATRAEATAKQEAATARQISAFLVQLFKLSNPNRPPGTPATLRELLERGTRTIETELKGQPAAQANLFGTLSQVYEALGLYRDSEALADKALTLPRAAVRDADLQRAGVLLDLGRSNLKTGQTEEARKAYEEALAIRTRVLGNNHLDVGRALNSLGGALGHMDRFDEAISYHQRALAIQRSIGGPNHPQVGVSLRGLGNVYYRKGDFEAALESFRGAQTIFETKYGDGHPLVAESLHNVAIALDRLDKTDESRKLLERSLDIRKRALSPNHPALASSYHSLGRVLATQGNLKAALPLYEEAVRIRSAAMGPDNPRTTAFVESLAMLRVRMGDLAGGLQLLERSLRNNERAYGLNDSHTLKSRRNLALTLVKAKRYDEAIPHLREITMRDVASELRIDLDAPVFDRMRVTLAFQKLEAEVSQRSGGAAP